MALVEHDNVSEQLIRPVHVIVHYPLWSFLDGSAGLQIDATPAKRAARIFHVGAGNRHVLAYV